MTADRVVVDTSILISAALSAAGKPAKATDYIVAQGALVLSQPTFDELVSRLERPKFDRYISTSGRLTFLDKLAAAAVWVHISGTVHAAVTPVMTSSSRRQSSEKRAAS